MWQLWGTVLLFGLFDDFDEVLMALNEGGMQYLIAGARGNVGLKGGRHVFEACGQKKS